MAGDMALWMGPGRKVFERAWEERPILALELTGVLSDMNWGGWRLIAQPHVSKRILVVLDTYTQQALETLCALQRNGRLESTDAAWRERQQAWVDARFQRWSGSDEQVSLLHMRIPGFPCSLIRTLLDI